MASAVQRLRPTPSPSSPPASPVAGTKLDTVQYKSPSATSHPTASPSLPPPRCRFEDEDLRVLEAALSAGADVPALLATRSAARSLLRASAAEAFASTATGSVLLDGGSSLDVADFFARAFALVADVEVSTAPNKISGWRMRFADYALLLLVLAPCLYLGFYSDLGARSCRASVQSLVSIHS